MAERPNGSATRFVVFLLFFLRSSQKYEESVKAQETRAVRASSFVSFFKV